MNYQKLGLEMMDAARTYPNDTISCALARVGDKLAHQGLPFVKAMDEVDKMVMAFFISKVKQH